MARVSAIVCAAAVLLAGCVRGDLDMTVSENDTISGTIIAAATDSVLEATGESPETFFEDSKDEIASELPTGATAEEYRQDGYTGAKATYKDVPLDEFNDSDIYFGNTDAGAKGESLKITRTGDTFVVSGAADLAFDAGGYGALTRGMEVTISLTFPGKVTEATGTVSGNTVTWTPQVGEVTELSATANAASGSLPWVLWIGLGAIAVIVAAATSAVVIAVRKRKTAPASGAATVVSEYR